ncbi:ligand-dependent nuclear receptor-interacting factor 1-like isoform X1 [Hemiscyllium ocellatum]|uniref:ligand-dependent nuclear receptor-interacting factor 1-like isoform X1 n=2 Tax=Hemiscyllium ocellatum TaxID=170820 RepID=UPI002966C234|nr:ligand-dependent nuclear receptor-interacting factor 1-like isoform X1 [Hemiscyllium ocellatum]
MKGRGRVEGSSCRQSRVTADRSSSLASGQSKPPMDLSRAPASALSMSSPQSLVVQSPDISGTIPCNSGCMYRIVQTTGLDGKNLLKLIPLSNMPGHYIPAIPLPISVSTTATSSKVNVSTVFHMTASPKTTTCNAPTCFPVLQHANTGKILITSLEGSTTQTATSPINPSQNNTFPASAVPSLQCPNLTAVTLPSLPVQKVQATPSLTTSQKSSDLRTVSLPALPVQGTQACSTLAPDQMVYNLSTATFPGPSVQTNQASSTLAIDQNTYMLLKSPVLPAGHHLQIPANAEVKSVPASSLPIAIRQKILSTTATNFVNTTASAMTSPTVIYVCPVNTVKTVQKRLQNIRPKNILNVPTTSTTGFSPALSTNIPPVVACGEVVSNAEQNLPKDSPMKWVVQANPQSLAHCLIPVKSSNNLASEILKSLADQQNMESATNLIPLPATASTQMDSDLFSLFKENALVMYNGKVYLVVQKNGGLPSSHPESAPASTNHAETDTTLPAVVSPIDLLTKIKEEPEDPDPKTATQENKFINQPIDSCTTTVSHQDRSQDLPGSLHEHSNSTCGTTQGETDEQLLKKAGIYTSVRICLTRISQKQLDQWEKGTYTANSKPPELYSQLPKKIDNIKTEAVCKQTQVILTPPAIKTEPPIETEYYATHTKEIEVKLEPESPVKRKAESIQSSPAVKKQCLKRFIPNWESEHAYSCLPVYNTEAASHNTEAASHNTEAVSQVASHCEQETTTSFLEPSSVLNESTGMVSPSGMTLGTGTESVSNCLDVSTIPVPMASTSSPPMEYTAPTEISAACSYTPLPSSSIDEITRDEKIKRLKAILKEKEAALEAIRKKMMRPKSPEKSKGRHRQRTSSAKKSRCKKWLLNRESEHAYSCLSGGGHSKPPGQRASSTPAAEHTSPAVGSAPSQKSLSPHEGLPPPSTEKSTRDEKIKRLKEILKEKEAALETIRRKRVSMPST